MEPKYSRIDPSYEWGIGLGDREGAPRLLRDEPELDLAPRLLGDELDLLVRDDRRRRLGLLLALVEHLADGVLPR